MTDRKTCARCGKQKHTTDFWLVGSGGQRHVYCKTCHAIDNRHRDEPDPLVTDPDDADLDDFLERTPYEQFGRLAWYLMTTADRTENIDHKVSCIRTALDALERAHAFTEG